jgi:hypothetical protein
MTNKNTHFIWEGRRPLILLLINNNNNIEQATQAAARKNKIGKY